MIFWIVVFALALAVCALLVLALWRGGKEGAPAAAFDLQVYRDQLAEVERDLARGIVNEDDADRVRTEISRRILAADAAVREAQSDGTATRGMPVFAALVSVAMVFGSALIYLQIGQPGYGDLALADRMEFAKAMRAERPTQLDAEASLSPADFPPAPDPSPDYVALVTQLREVIATRPDDVQGLRLLAVSERNLGNYAAARDAFGRYVTLRGTDATPQEFSDLADMLILAAGGYVSPEAEAALTLALQADPTNGPARYYWGLMLSQTGRPDLAFRFWDQLLRAGPPDAPWIPPVQAQIEEIAARAGVNYVMPEPGNIRGPSAEDIQNAGEMSPAERMEMIGGMVEGLSERLASEGGTVSEWAQLISALGVLERRNDAFAVYQNALEVFAEDPTALDQINRAGSRAGVAN